MWIFLFLFLFLTSADPVQAGAVVGAIGTVVSWLGAGSIGATIVGSLVRFAVGFGLSYLAKRIIEKRRGKDQEQQPPGLSGRVLTGGIIPRSFPFGRYPPELSLAYVGTYGEVNNTPNAYLVLVVAMSDLPINRIAELWIGGERVSWNVANRPGTEYAIPQYRKEPFGKEDDSEVDHMWITYFDGTQSSASSFLTDKFGSDPNRPYASNRVGTGVAYMIVRVLTNPDLFSSFPAVQPIVDGVPFYDVRLDSTAGGSGSQRWSTPSTWRATTGPINLIQAAYNIVRGIQYSGDWVFGGQTIAEVTLPFASWSAALSECDVQVNLLRGGTEKQYLGGGTIRFGDEPLTVIERILKGCNGRMAEVGGFFKVRAGAAGVSVFSFTDSDIIISQRQQFDPFPSLGEVVNGVSAHYPGPDSGWILKDAPQLRDTALEAEDGGRRQLADVTYEYVSSGAQVQRLQKSQLLDERAFRRHALPMPPDAFVIEPLDVVTWSSDRNGYVSKTFDVLEADDLGNLDMLLALKELDPNAYDWDASTDEQIIIDGPLIVVRPDAQEITGWAAVGELVTYDSGQRKPGVRISWDADVTDVIGVRFQIRLKSSSALLVDATTIAWATGRVLITQGLASITNYQVRGKYQPGSARATNWSAWLDFTTPDARVTRAELNTGLNALVQRIEERVSGDISQIRTDLDVLANSITGTSTLQEEGLGWLTTNVGNKFLENVAAITSESTIRADADSAAATTLTTLTARVAANEGDVATNIAGILTNASALADATSAAAATLTILTARVLVNEENVATNVAEIIVNASALANATSAAATTMTALTARVAANEGDVADNVAAIITNATAIVDASSAVATTLTTLTARVAANEGDIATNVAAIITNASTVAEANSAAASTVTALTARVAANEGDVADNVADIVVNATAIATNNSALGAFILALFAETSEGAAEGLFRIALTSAPTGVGSSIALQARATTDDTWYESGIYLDAGVTALGGASRIRMKADSLQFSDNDTSLYPLLEITDDELRIRGTVKAQALVSDLITSDHIKGGQITTDKLDALSITTAKINGLAVDNSKIGNLAVSTGKVADNAITQIVSALASGEINTDSGSDLNWVDAITLSITRNSNSVLDLMYFFEMTEEQFGYFVRIEVEFRQGNSLKIYNGSATTVETTDSDSSNHWKGGSYVYTYVDSRNISGSKTYRIRIRAYRILNQSGNRITHQIGVKNRYLRLMERQK